MAHHPRRFHNAQCCLMIAALATAVSSHAGGVVTDWDFAVQLDKRPIGTHRFTLQPTEGNARELVSEARFDVKFLGFTVYRYHHQNAERWKGDCLTPLAANTDDHGDTTIVKGSESASSFRVVANTGRKSTSVDAQGCVVSFAYWLPQQLARQSRLLDPGTGRIEPVNITALPASTIDVHGAPAAVTGLRIDGLKHPIDVWYADGRWVGLDTAVDGGRVLTYRLP